MPTSAAGNKPARSLRGFTLIELMVVVALIAIATTGVSLSLRDSAAEALERDAQRLAAVLESARAQSRANGVAVVWQPHDGGFVLRGLTPAPTPQGWLSATTRAQAGPPVVLGPEPLIPPQQVVLYSTASGNLRLRVASDGLQPFTVRRDAAAGGLP